MGGGHQQGGSKGSKSVGREDVGSGGVVVVYGPGRAPSLFSFMLPHLIPSIPVPAALKPLKPPTRGRLWIPLRRSPEPSWSCSGTGRTNQNPEPDPLVLWMFSMMRPPSGSEPSTSDPNGPAEHPDLLQSGARVRRCSCRPADRRVRFSPTCQSRFSQRTRTRFHSGKNTRVRSAAQHGLNVCGQSEPRHPRVRALSGQEVLLVPAGPVRGRHARRSASASHSKKASRSAVCACTHDPVQLLSPGKTHGAPPSLEGPPVGRYFAASRFWTPSLLVDVQLLERSRICMPASDWLLAAAASALIGCSPSLALPDWSQTTVTSRWTLI